MLHQKNIILQENCYVNVTFNMHCYGVFALIFIWKRLSIVSGKSGKLREFHFAELVSTLIRVQVLIQSLV